MTLDSIVFAGMPVGHAFPDLECRRGIALGKFWQHDSTVMPLTYSGVM
jgi:hypothetical protein